MAFYFVLRERHMRWAKVTLWGSILIGIAFGIAQQARGAHFLSHDVFSAFLVWMVSLSIYVFVFGCNVTRSVVSPVAAARTNSRS